MCIRDRYFTLHSEPTVISSNFSQILSGGRILNRDNSHIVYIQLRLEDINNVKLYPTFGTEVSNTFVTVFDSAIMDLSLHPNGLIGTTLQAREVIEDQVNPRLRMFTVDLNAGRLILYFNEPVNVTTFIPYGLTLQSAVRSRTGVRLSNSYSLSGHGQSIVVTLSNENLNEIKRIDALLISQDTSYITITTELIQDMSGNEVDPIINGFALMASGFVEDMGRPYIAFYDLDMDAGYVTLYFSETVNASSLMCDQLTFAANEECSVSYMLTDCTVDTRNVSYDSVDVGTSGSGSGDYGSAPKWITPYHYSTSVSFWLTLGDHNQLKALDIARSASSTFLSYTNDTILDQNDLPLLERNCTNMALPVDSARYIPDTTPPEIVNFNLSLDEGKLVISFTETIQSSTLQVRGLTLQSTDSIDNITQNHTLGLDNSTMSVDGPTDVLTIYIFPDDLNRIKFLAQLAVSNDSTYLAASSFTVTDTKGNRLVNISSDSALPVNQFVPDTTPPSLVSYDLDMNLGRIFLTFDETVNIDTLNFTSLTLQVLTDLSILDAADVNDTIANGTDLNETNISFSGSGDIVDLSFYDACRIFFFELTGGELVSFPNSTQLTFQLTQNDLNNIKREPCLATADDSTHLSFEGDAILDMNGNGIDPVSRNDSIMVTSFTPDTTSPRLVGFDLNLTSEVLTLHFDETVNATSFDPTQITFLSQNIMLVMINISTESNNTEFDNTTDTNLTSIDTLEYLTYEVNYTLSGGMLLIGDDPTLFLQLSEEDLNIIKSLTELATDEENTFISITAALVRDMNLNPVNEISSVNASMVSQFTEDRIPPTLVSFNLDLNDEILMLTFDETVNVSSLNFSGLTLLSNSTSLPEEFWSLNGGDPPLHSYSLSPNQPVIVIEIGYNDINEIKRLSLLATSNQSSYLSIAPAAILDMNNNPVVGIPFETAVQVSQYTEGHNTTRTCEI